MMLFCESKTKPPNDLFQVLIESIPCEVGELMTAELLALGLLDKADVQNQTDKNPAIKNTLCMALPIIWA